MQAAYYFFYTFIGSIFMLLAIFTLYNSECLANIQGAKKYERSDITPQGDGEIPCH